MCAGISACLRPGGRFVTVNSNPAMDFSALPSYRRYGFDTRGAGEIRQGMPVTWTFFLEDGPLEIENYYLDVPAHEAAFRAAGFREIRWHAPRLSQEGKTEFGEDFWADFLDHPPVIFIECLKAAGGRQVFSRPETAAHWSCVSSNSKIARSSRMWASDVVPVKGTTPIWVR